MNFSLVDALDSLMDAELDDVSNGNDEDAAVTMDGMLVGTALALLLVTGIDEEDD